MGAPGRTRGLGLVLAALALGCPEKEAPAAPPDSGEAAAGGKGTPARVGVKVPLPSGWTARIAEDGSFQAGPPGEPKLRVDIRPGQGKSLPTAEEMARAVPKAFKDFGVVVKEREAKENLVLLEVLLAPRRKDGGHGEQYLALFGAKRVSEDLFLCASVPGASAEDVKRAREACREIVVQPPPK